MKFKLPRYVGIPYILLVLSTVLLVLMPSISAELSGENEIIYITGDAVSEDTSTQDTTKFNYDSADGYLTLIKIFYWIAFIMGSVSGFVVGYENPNPDVKVKSLKRIIRISRIIHFICGVIGFIAMILFINFYQTISATEPAYSLTIYFYLGTVVFGIMAVVGFIATISKIDIPFEPKDSAPTFQTTSTYNDY